MQHFPAQPCHALSLQNVATSSFDSRLKRKLATILTGKKGVGIGFWESLGMGVLGVLGCSSNKSDSQCPFTANLSGCQDISVVQHAFLTHNVSTLLSLRPIPSDEKDNAARPLQYYSLCACVFFTKAPTKPHFKVNLETIRFICKSMCHDDMSMKYIIYHTYSIYSIYSITYNHQSIHQSFTTSSCASSPQNTKGPIFINCPAAALPFFSLQRPPQDSCATIAPCIGARLRFPPLHLCQAETLQPIDHGTLKRDTIPVDPSGKCGER